MNAIPSLLTGQLGIWITAETEKKSGRGRSGSNGVNVYGIRKLRELILELAVRGKLVPQDPDDEPAGELLKHIQVEKAKLVAVGKIKKDKPLPPITDEEKPFELPQGWEWVRLGEITNFGITEKLDFIPDETWVLDLEDIEKDTSRLLQKYKFSERNSLSAKNSFQTGDVLYGKLRPYLNKVIVADEAGVCTTEILPFRCFGPFSSNYFKFALRSPYFISYVNARSYGMKMPRLGTEDGRKAYFPLPSLAEQHRIVTKVDELMALCDQLETQHINAAEAHEKLVNHLLGTLTRSQNADDFSTSWQRIAAHFDALFTTEASIDVLRQTLLQLAVMGKLVPQDPDDEPASELLKRIQAEKARLVAEGRIKKDKPLPPIADEEKPFELPQGWEWVRIGYISHDWGQKTPDTDFTYIAVSAIDSKRGVILSPELIKPGNAPSRARKIVKEDTVIYSTIRPYLLNIAVIEKEFLPEPIASTAFAIVHPFCSMPSRYFLYFFRSSVFVRYVESVQMGIAYPAINDRQFFSGSIPLPPLPEQHRIVAKVDELMVLCDQLKSRITQSGQLQKKLADAVVEQAIAS